MADVANFTREELKAYNFNVKHHWDSYAVLKTAYDEGVKAGMAKGLVKGERIGGKIATFLKQFTHKLGSIPPDIEKTIRAMDNEYQIDSISSHISVIDGGETLKTLLQE